MIDHTNICTDLAASAETFYNNMCSHKYSIILCTVYMLGDGELKKNYNFNRPKIVVVVRRRARENPD